jgi:hypothetical protein
MNTLAADIGFVDTLGLGESDFANTRVLVLCGESGSGKSSAIRFLMQRHRHYRGDARVRVIEELRGWRDLGVFLRALVHRDRLLVASHLPAWLHRGLGILARTRVIALDCHPQKISHWLAAHDVGFSDAAVAEFCRRFGANYTDARLILQHAQATSFDQALGRFLRQCRLQRDGMPSGLPVLVMPVAEAEAHYLALNEAGIKQIP